MSLKEEIGKIEEEEELIDETDLEQNREQETRDKITGLYRRIDVIADYIDRVIPEKDKNEKESTSSEYAKGYKDGVKALSEKMGLDSAGPQNEYNMEIIKAIQAALAIKTPGTDWKPLIEIMAMQNTGSKEETDETEEINKKLLDAMQKLLRVVTSSPTLEKPEEKETEKKTGAGLGHEIGDV